TDPLTPSISPLSLHDALPIWPALGRLWPAVQITGNYFLEIDAERLERKCTGPVRRIGGHRFGSAAPDIPQRFRRHLVPIAFGLRSEEHTSELQSLTNLVCRLL